MRISNAAEFKSRYGEIVTTAKSQLRSPRPETREDFATAVDEQGNPRYELREVMGQFRYYPVGRADEAVLEQLLAFASATEFEPTSLGLKQRTYESALDLTGFADYANPRPGLLEGLRPGIIQDAANLGEDLKGVNVTIEGTREQLQTLGPAQANEAPEVAQRRAELNAQLRQANAEFRTKTSRKIELDRLAKDVTSIGQGQAMVTTARFSQGVPIDFALNEAIRQQAEARADRDQRDVRLGVRPGDFRLGIIGRTQHFRPLKGVIETTIGGQKGKVSGTVFQRYEALKAKEKTSKKDKAFIKRYETGEFLRDKRTITPLSEDAARPQRAFTEYKHGTAKRTWEEFQARRGGSTASEYQREFENLYNFYDKGEERVKESVSDILGPREIQLYEGAKQVGQLPAFFEERASRKASRAETKGFATSASLTKLAEDNFFEQDNGLKGKAREVTQVSLADELIAYSRQLFESKEDLSEYQQSFRDLIQVRYDAYLQPAIAAVGRKRITKETLAKIQAAWDTTVLTSRSRVLKLTWEYNRDIIFLQDKITYGLISPEELRKEVQGLPLEQKAALRAWNKARGE